MSRHPVLLVVEANARTYRRTWRANVITTFLNPVLFLAAMGLGLGSLVDRSTGPEALEAASYLKFLAPGLLAATAMQTGAGDSAYPVMAGIKWIKNYAATLATPVGVGDLTLGHFGWIAIRLTLVSLVYVGVSLAFGAIGLAGGLLAVLPAVLVGLAVATPVMAYTARLENEQGLASLFRFAIMPMFLFSGTFFPVSQLPDWMEPLAYLTPLWHGVELTRAAALDTAPAWAPLGHVAYLLAWFAGGLWLALRTMRRRLVI